MRRVLAVVTALVVAGMLWGSARPVAAICQSFSFENYDLVASGTIVEVNIDEDFVGVRNDSSRPSGGEVQAVFEVERYYQGFDAERITVLGHVNQVGTSMFDEESVGQQWLLHLMRDRDEGDQYVTSSCWRNKTPFVDAELSLSLGDYREPYRGGFPTVPTATAAVLGPVVFLAGASFVWGRKGGAG